MMLVNKTLCSEIKYEQYAIDSPAGRIRREWRLGKGPCGKVVTYLQATLYESHLYIEQYCENQRNPDMFVVPMKTICSTIQLFPYEPTSD